MLDNIHIKAKATDLTTDRIATYSNKIFIPFGIDNLFPQQVAKLSREAANHRAILNSKQLYIEGKSLLTDDKKLEDYLKQIRFKNNILGRIIIDYLMGGNAYVEIVTDKRGNLLNIFHQDFTKCRLNKNNDAIIIHNNWSNFKETEATTVGLYPNFTIGSDGFRHSIIHLKDYEPEFTYYGVPSWFAGLRAAQISKKTNEFNDERLSNKFSIDGMLTIPGIEDVEDAKRMDKKLKSFQGSEKAGKIIPLYLKPLGVGETREIPTFISLNENADGVFLDLHKQSDSDLIKIHSWYRSLSAFEENTGFDTQRIKNDYSIAMATVIEPMQEKFKMLFNEIFAKYGFGEFTIYNENPVYVPNDVEYIWEVRKKLGLDYDENDARQQAFYAELGTNKKGLM